jgi:hypothetical protein
VHVNSVEVSLNPNAPTPPALTPPPAAAVNQEDIVITAPEAGNMITSTVHVAGESEPTFEQTLLVRVFDQDGATLAEKSTIIAADAGQRGKFALDLPIELPAAPEAGRVVVLTTSPRDGGITHLASVEVKLSGKATP